MTHTPPEPLEQPYALLKPYSDPRYFKTLKQAKRVIEGDLEKISHWSRRLGVTNPSVPMLLRDLGEIDSSGGKLDRVVDLPTGTRYTAEIVKRVTG